MSSFILYLTLWIDTFFCETIVWSLQQKKTLKCDSMKSDINGIMGPLTIRIFASFGCFILLLLLGFLFIMCFICNTGSDTNQGVVMGGDTRDRKNTTSTTF